MSAGQVIRQWGNQVDSILDGGRVPGGKGSTIVHCEGSHCHILRAGVISGREITEALLDR